MSRFSTLLSLVLAACLGSQLQIGAVPEQLFPSIEVEQHQFDLSQESASGFKHPQPQPQLSVKDTLKEILDSMEPSANKKSAGPPPTDHDKYEMLKNLQVARNVREDKCNKSSLENLNYLADVTSHLYSESVSDYVSFYRNKQFKLCQEPAVEALRGLLAREEAQVEGDGVDRHLQSVVDLGERVRRQGIKLFGSKETRKALLFYLHEKDLHPWESSGGEKASFYGIMEHLLDSMCWATVEPHIVEMLDVLEQLHGDHSLNWDLFHVNEINFIVGSIACRDILADKQPYLNFLFNTLIESGGIGGQHGA